MSIRLHPDCGQKTENCPHCSQRDDQIAAAVPEKLVDVQIAAQKKVEDVHIAPMNVDRILQTMRSVQKLSKLKPSNFETSKMKSSNFENCNAQTFKF